MKWTLVALSLLLCTPATFADNLRIEVDLSTRMLSAYDGPNIIRTYKVSVGEQENPTPTGTFRIRKLIWNPSWVPPKEKWARGKKPKGPTDPDNPMKAVKMFFREPDYYIHGTPAVSSMGRARSKGCVRMRPEDATDLAKVVMAYGGKPMPEPWYRRVLRRKTTKVVILEKPIAMRITT